LHPAPAGYFYRGWAAATDKDIRVGRLRAMVGGAAEGSATGDGGGKADKSLAE